MKMLVRALGLVLLLTGSELALANPVLCSPGYQDSTCPTPIARGPVPAPQCSSGAGWTTTSNPVWQGAYWSSPGCSYQPPPSCPPGYNQTTSPIWYGSSWGAPGCTPSTPPPPPPNPSLRLYVVTSSMTHGFPASVPVPGAYQYAYGVGGFASEFGNKTDSPFMVFGNVAANQIDSWVLGNSVAMAPGASGCTVINASSGPQWNVCFDGSTGPTPNNKGGAWTSIYSTTGGPGSCWFDEISERWCNSGGSVWTNGN